MEKVKAHFLSAEERPEVQKDTKSNPADNATRGLSGAKLTVEYRWFSGHPVSFKG